MEADVMFLLYADDLLVFCERPSGLQEMLKVLNPQKPPNGLHLSLSS